MHYNMLGVIGNGLYTNENKITVLNGRLVNLRPWAAVKQIAATKNSPPSEIPILPATQEEMKQLLEMKVVSSKNIGELPKEVEETVIKKLQEFTAKYPQYASKYAEVQRKAQDKTQ